jgi:hypothetical protein
MAAPRLFKRLFKRVFEAMVFQAMLAETPPALS